MAFLQASGAISLADIKNLFGGNYAASSYYRGGAYIPSQKTVSTIVREPSSGEYFNQGQMAWSCYLGVIRFVDGYNPNLISHNYNWFGSSWPVSGDVSSYTVGGYTYYRGSYHHLQGYNDGYGISTWYFHYIYRTSGSSYQQNINTGIPTSGTISLSQFYGAEKP